ncbi:TlpA family protein disulfide reductase [Ekhidna sp.]|uniref:TlpA family protein disulfide reductase n=1 Tax=Ekhidna sp. TaxID=2608089 RepID=UPI003B512FA5
MRHSLILFFSISWILLSAQDKQDLSDLSPEEFYTFIFETKITEEEDFQKGIPNGEIFSDSTFLTINGDELSFIDTEYELTVVDFWFKGCSGCKQEKEFVKQVIEKYEDDPRIRFVAITPTDEKGIERVIKKHGDYYKDIISVGGFKNCELLFKFKGFPRHVLVDNNGRVLATYFVPIFNAGIQKEYEKRILSFLR